MNIYAVIYFVGHLLIYMSLIGESYRLLKSVIESAAAAEGSELAMFEFQACVILFVLQLHPPFVYFDCLFCFLGLSFYLTSSAKRIGILNSFEWNLSKTLTMKSKTFNFICTLLLFVPERWREAFQT